MNETSRSTTMDGVWERSAILDAQLSTCERGLGMAFTTLHNLPAEGDEGTTMMLGVAVLTLEAWLDNHLAVAQATGTEIQLAINSLLGTVN